MYAVRETIESIVIAFVLAFLFRTFEAEAFVIPTGSMSPSLQGQHKDVHCSECGYRFRTTASNEANDQVLALKAKLNQTQRTISILKSQMTKGQSDWDRGRLDSDLRIALESERALDARIRSFDTVVGMCPICRQQMAMRPDLPPGVPVEISTNDLEEQKTYPGDRILVNKYCYNNSEPDRWDVVVFKFPGDGEMNYIKRLVGLSNETLQLYQGDVFIRDDATGDDSFSIERKPADKVEAMLQIVHDTDHDPTILYDAGWPLRWESATAKGWTIDAKPQDKTVQQTYRVSPAAGDNDSLAWLHYRHYVPQQSDWAVVRNYEKDGDYGKQSKSDWLAQVKPELIRDFNPYNADRARGGSFDRRFGQSVRGIHEIGWDVPPDKLGMHWVGDLAIECDVNIEKQQGELHLELVEAGQHFVCQIDLSTGQAVVSIPGHDQFTATAETSLDATGSYHLRFANIDDQLLLWVDGDEVSLGDNGPALAYDADEVFDGRRNAIPVATEADPGDLAPVRIGARDAAFSISRMQVLRDIYYIATSWERPSGLEQICDYPHPLDEHYEDGERIAPLKSVRQQFTDPEVWSPRFLHRRTEDFEINDEQLFVMGDNSPASSDCRLWAGGNGSKRSRPGGPYLDRKLLIGKAVCVFWPHSWGEVPLIRRLPGFPNFGDMRLVR